MMLRNERELVNTRNKLRMLEEMYSAIKTRDEDIEGGERVRQLGMQSLKRLILQLQEEILRYEACQVVRR